MYTSITTKMDLFLKRRSNGTVNSQYNLHLENNHNLYWRTLPNSGGNSHDSSLTTNNLHHGILFQLLMIQVTKKIFLNGNLSTSDSYSGTIVQNPNGISLIGKHPNGYFFNGLIDDVRIYDRALSAAEVQALYNMGQ